MPAGPDESRFGRTLTSVTRVNRDAAAAAADGAALVLRAAEGAVAERGRFLLGVSGGRTPARLFNLLGRQPRVPWRETH
ncbi:MAG: 6-phosphogluconolactonase, partial [Longimicrobiales bacterium]